MSEVLALPIEEEIAMRAQVRGALAAILPAEHVDVVADLAVHAVQEALRTLERSVGASGDTRHFLAALGPAVGLVAGRCAMIENAVKNYATMQGLRQAQSAVRFGGGR